MMLFGGNLLVIDEIGSFASRICTSFDCSCRFSLSVTTSTERNYCFAALVSILQYVRCREELPAINANFYA